MDDRTQPVPEGGDLKLYCRTRLVMLTSEDLCDVNYFDNENDAPVMMKQCTDREVLHSKNRNFQQHDNANE